MKAEHAKTFIAGVQAARLAVIGGASSQDLADWLKGLDIWLQHGTVGPAPTIWQSVDTEAKRRDALRALNAGGV